MVDSGKQRLSIEESGISSNMSGCGGSGLALILGPLATAMVSSGVRGRDAVDQEDATDDLLAETGRVGSDIAISTTLNVFCPSSALSECDNVAPDDSTPLS